MREYQLFIGRKFSGVIVRPDDKYPQMFRIHANGRISDMVNLARAKDAARTWLEGKDAVVTPNAFTWRVRQMPRQKLEGSGGVEGARAG
jgi:hypothetical protein